MITKIPKLNFKLNYWSTQHSKELFWGLHWPGGECFAPPPSTRGSAPSWSFKPGETICTFSSVFLWQLWIDVFVWARVVCGPRYDQSPWLGTSPVLRKIHVRKIERQQGYSRYDNIEEFLDLRPSPASKMSSGEQNRVLTHSIERPTWIEELASESNTIQAQWFIFAPGRLELRTMWN